MTTEPPEKSPRTTSNFLRTHCQTCAAGWTRRTHKGPKLVVCLLDRQPVIPEIADCDRYELALPKTLQ